MLLKMNESSSGSRDQQISRASGANDGCFSERERDNVIVRDVGFNFHFAISSEFVD